CTAGLARIFGASRTAPRDYDPQSGLRPLVLRSTVRLNVHTAPSIDSASSHVLPNDGVVVGLYGQARGATSSAEGEGALTFFVVSEGTVGWASARYLAPFHGCLPSSADIADDLAEELGPADEEDLDVEDPLERADRILANAITARTHVFFDGRRQDAFVLASSDEEARESVVLVYRLDADCAITRLGAHWLPGLLDEHFLTETMVGGGETLVVASYASRDTRAADGLYDWVARRIDSSQDLWQSRLRTQANVPERQRVGIGGTRDRIARSRETPFVLAVREPDQERRWYVWQDGAVVLEGTTGAPAPAPPIEQPNLE
ncbi:MAG: hypothetical protein K8H88_33380, partial [Sandaracinaceae bacterium]|nr:hypothetical protein [Sandaracinaceae bacterium]